MSKNKTIVSFMDRLMDPQLHSHDLNSGDEADLEMEQLWNQLPESFEIAENDSSAKNRFAAILEGYALATESFEKPKRVTDWKWVKFPALLPYAAAFLIGILGWNGILQHQQINEHHQEMRELRNWISQMVLQPTPSTERINDLYFASQQSIDSGFVTDTTINDGLPSSIYRDQLIRTLRTDPSVNVRLSSLQLLSTFTIDSDLKNRLFQSIAYQESTMIILEIAQLYANNCTRQEMTLLVQELTTSGIDQKWIRRFQIQEGGQI